MNSLKNEKALQDQFIAHKKTLALAESCTGGLIGASLTDIPGSSAYFLGSIVAYSNALKRDILHVKEKTLIAHGGVSKEVAEEMALGLFSITTCDYALAVTGVAGPDGGTQEKPVGMVWGAIAERGGEVRTYLLQLKGGREQIRQQAKERLLGYLLDRFSSPQTPI